MSLVEVLEMFPSIKPDLANFFEAVPRLQARLYTVASSSKVHPKKIHVVAGVIRDHLPGQKRMFFGVCTNQLARSDSGSSKGDDSKKSAIVYGYLKPSTFIIPRDTSVPYILIGPGTGFAPMRAILQERAWQKEKGMPTGPTWLFFGCRSREEDFIYQDEILRACQDGIVTALHTAFSREGPQKVYVQHKIRENAAELWDLISTKKAVIFVCGSSSMGKDVLAAFEEIIRGYGNLPGQKAKYYLENMQRMHRYVQELWS